MKDWWGTKVLLKKEKIHSNFNNFGIQNVAV